LGHRVYFFYNQSAEAAAALAAKTGATPIRCNVADIQAVAAAFRQIGHVDNLVCNAGIWKGGLVQDISETDWDRLFDVNVKGVYNCIKAALPSFLNHHSGSIVTVSSMWGQVGASCESAYAATKGAVIALTKSLAKELGPSGIRVNCVAPGVILTDMCAGYSEEDLQALANETPLGRNGQPEDVANAIAFLLEAEFITGHVLNVDGGFVI
jgi:3-oxoacyl-[acyl-carrier protein] reductase